MNQSLALINNTFWFRKSTDPKAKKPDLALLQLQVLGFVARNAGMSPKAKSLSLE